MVVVEGIGVGLVVGLDVERFVLILNTSSISVSVTSSSDVDSEKSKQCNDGFLFKSKPTGSS